MGTVSPVDSLERSTTGADTPPRVVHIVRSLEIGGLERVVFELVMMNRAARPSVGCLVALGPLGEELRARGVAVDVIGMEGSRLKTVFRLRRYLRRVGPTVVHCHNLLSHLYGGLAARLSGLSHVVLTKHGAFLPEAGVSWCLNRWLLKRSHVVAVSAEIESLLTARLGPKGFASLEEIPNGISMEPYAVLSDRVAARRSLRWHPDRPLIGTVARLAEGKGHDDLLHAFVIVRRSFPQARLIIVGDGPYGAKIGDTIRALALDDSVEMLGERHDVPQILAALDVFALASQTEGVPMTILEAMAAGLPVVSTNVGGIPQVLSGRTGLLVPPRSPEALAEATIRLLRDPELARRLGQAGRQRIEEAFHVRIMAARYNQLYLKLAASRRG